MPRLFLVDTQLLVRQNLRAILVAAPNLSVVGKASHGSALLDQLPALPAEAVLLSLRR